MILRIIKWLPLLFILQSCDIYRNKHGKVEWFPQRKQLKFCGPSQETVKDEYRNLFRDREMDVLDD